MLSPHCQVADELGSALIIHIVLYLCSVSDDHSYINNVQSRPKRVFMDGIHQGKVNTCWAFFSYRIMTHFYLHEVLIREDNLGRRFTRKSKSKCQFSTAKEHVEHTSLATC